MIYFGDKSFQISVLVFEFTNEVVLQLIKTPVSDIILFTF